MKYPTGWLATGVLGALALGVGCAQQVTATAAKPAAGQQASGSPAAAGPGMTPESLKVDIESMKAAKPAWREIAWKSCLLEGLKESREKKKPVLLWVFIDRPADDARC